MDQSIILKVVMFLSVSFSLKTYSTFSLPFPFKTFLHPSLTDIVRICLLTGAKQPNYLVTADDVDTYLVIEVQPLDNRKRKVLSLFSCLR